LVACASVIGIDDRYTDGGLLDDASTGDSSAPDVDAGPGFDADAGPLDATGADASDTGSDADVAVDGNTSDGDEEDSVAPGTPCGSAIAVGSNDDVWILGCNVVALGGFSGNEYPIYHKVGSTWTQVPGSAAHIAVSPAGTPWTIKGTGDVLVFDSGQWNPTTGGCALSIGVGGPGAGAGATWIIGCTAFDEGGYGVYQFETTTWVLRSDTTAVAVAVSPEGTPWAIGAQSNLYFYDSGKSALVQTSFSGCVKNVAAGPNGDVWLITCAGTISHYRLGDIATQVPVPGTIARMAVSPEGSTWFIDTSGRVFSYPTPHADAGLVDAGPADTGPSD
jgi:hypothetical protein